MKKIYCLICALLVTLLIVGCAALKEEAAPTKETAKAEPQVEIKEEVKEAAAEEKVAAPAPATTKTPTTTTAPKTEAAKPVPQESTAIVEQSKEVSPELKALLETADRKLQSMAYLYAGPTTQNRFLNTYLVKGKYIKVDLYEVDPYVIDSYFDAVYLDTEAKTATGRCEDKKRCMSTNVDNTKKIFNVSYDDYRIKTSYEWVKELTFAEIVGPELMDGRGVTKVKYHDARSSTEMWIDNTYGVPIKLVITYDDSTKETHQFKDYKFNTLGDADVKPTFT